jgi:DNA-binding PadR family transcriptional regulator
MARSFFLGDFEHVVLLALLRLGSDAYGTTIRREIEGQTGRSVSVGALYTALDRLERKGFATSSLADPTPQRGGRAKRYFVLTAAGHTALRHSRDVLQRMWRGLEPKGERA